MFARKSPTGMPWDGGVALGWLGGGWGGATLSVDGHQPTTPASPGPPLSPGKGSQLVPGSLRLPGKHPHPALMAEGLDYEQAIQEI